MVKYFLFLVQEAFLKPRILVQQCHLMSQEEKHFSSGCAARFFDLCRGGTRPAATGYQQKQETTGRIGCGLCG